MSVCPDERARPSAQPLDRTFTVNLYNYNISQKKIHRKMRQDIHDALPQCRFNLDLNVLSAGLPASGSGLCRQVSSKLIRSQASGEKM